MVGINSQDKPLSPRRRGVRGEKHLFCHRCTQMNADKPLTNPIHPIYLWLNSLVVSVNLCPTCPIENVDMKMWDYTTLFNFLMEGWHVVQITCGIFVPGLRAERYKASTKVIVLVASSTRVRSTLSSPEA